MQQMDSRALVHLATQGASSTRAADHQLPPATGMQPQLGGAADQQGEAQASSTQEAPQLHPAQCSAH